jgi:hypothetical protein
MEQGKKIVHYRGKVTLMPIGKAWVEPIDHPDALRVSNTVPVITSTVLSYDKGTGRLETKNTIYLPEETTNAG